MRRTFFVIMIAVMAWLFSASAFAASETWDGDQNTGVWATVLNWAEAGVVPGTGDTATFNSAGGIVDLINLGAGVTLGTLLFDNAACEAYTIGSAAGQTLTLNNGGGITVNLGVVQTQTIAANILLAPDFSNATLSNNGANDAFLLNVTGNITGQSAGADTLTLRGTDTGDNTVSGVIGNGAGGGALNVTKDDVGKWIISGVNTYTGATTITTGTLVLNATGSVAASSGVANAGTFTIQADKTIQRLTGAGATTLGANTLTIGDANNRSGNYTGAASGTGGITTNGTGTLTLSGVNTYTGATTLNAGSNLTLDATGSVAASSGVANAGTFTIQADKTIDSLTGAGQATLGGILTIGDASNASCTYSGVASGAGGITKAGTGTLVLSGTNTYAGATTINAGTLRVSNASALGAGAAANVAHNTAGTLDIGSTVLNIGGAYTQAGAATLMVDVNGTTSGSVVSGGAATVPTTANLVLAVSNYVPNNASYTIINGTGGAGVAALAITVTGSSRATFTATTIGEDLVLTASRAASGFASDATAGDYNADAVGTALDGITNPSGDMLTVLTTMEGLSNSQVAAALDTMVPQVDAGVINTSTAALNNFVGVSIDRAENVMKLANAADSAATGVSAGEAGKISGIWGKGYGSYLTQGARNNIAGYDAWNAGTAIGADHLFSDIVTLGISGGYAYGNVDSDVNNANTYINSAQTTVYGGYEDKNLPFFIDAAGSFAYNWYQGRRDINVGNVIFRTANADYDGQQYGAYIGGGYKFDVTKNIEFTPLVSVQYSHLQLGSYTETEAGALDLSVASQGYDQLQSGLGARVRAPIKCKWGTMTPEAHGKWFYDFIGDPFAVTSNFNGGGASFNSNGCKPALNSYNAGGQVEFDFKNDISIIGSCDTEMKDEFFGIYGSATVRYNF